MIENRIEKEEIGKNAKILFSFIPIVFIFIYLYPISYYALPIFFIFIFSYKKV